MSATLLEFATVNDAVAASAGKLRKQAILAEYLARLAEPELRLAVRYAAGRPFPATDARVLNVGGVLVSQVVLSILRIGPARFHDLIVSRGEIGEALSDAWPERLLHRNEAAPWDDALLHHPVAPAIEPGPTKELSLSDVAGAFDALAATGAWDRKHAILSGLFRRCRTGREAAYLAKIIFGDLRTGVQEGVLQAAIARAFDKQLTDIQRCQLLVGDLDEVAALAKADALSAARFRLFHPILPMLATPQESAEQAAETLAGRIFQIEDKLDGIRAQIHKSGQSAPGAGASARVVIYTRDLARVEGSFPDVAAAVSTLGGEFLLDGEIVPWRNGRVLPFAHIQKRLGRKAPSVKIQREHPCAFIAFDILYRDGQGLLDVPLRLRRQTLLQLVASSSTNVLLMTEAGDVSTADQIAAAFAAARARGNEGVVLKAPDSPYSPGRRGQLWLKLKTHLSTFDCVVTAAETGHGKRRNSLSDYTFAVWNRDPADPAAALVNIGKAYSGVTDEEIRQLTETFTRLTVKHLGRVRLVEPKIVLEIACDQIQQSTRHASGYALRFPRIKRIRWDKAARDADRLQRIAEVYESSANTARASTPAEVQRSEPTLFDGIEAAGRAH